MVKTKEVRQGFLDKFKSYGHTVVPSSPVIPHDDPTLLFTNAGMNQFKDVFLGEGTRDYSRAASSQKCVRVGGKHNDLENVGHTKRHLTFFEMLGNFSFGDYFKQEAIQMAWEVSTEVFQLDPNRLWPTVYEEDDEAFELWKKYVPEERITRAGRKDNFWEMGETGPCGPCSEIYYDRGPTYGKGNNVLEDTEQERFLEYWNLVFMQYNTLSDGKVEPLPRPSIDTGVGLERLLSIMMDVDSVFETDILRGIIAQIEKISGKKYDLKDHEGSAAFRVIADHLRCLAFAIADGAQPSNVERGYVLRKVLRRAVRYGRQLGFEKPYLARVLPTLTELMNDDYPELGQAQDRICEIVTAEEESFFRTLKRGGSLLQRIVDTAHDHGNQISGDDAFKLKDTYGLPFEEVTLLAKDAGLKVDTSRFEELEDKAKARSRKAHQATKQVAGENLFANFEATEFLGYTQQAAQGKIQAIVVDGAFVDELPEGKEGIVVLNRSPFYAEMGGQVGDTGILKSEKALFEVTDTQSPIKGVIGHVGKSVHGLLTVGSTMTAAIDEERREKIANNHTATHLLHWALYEVLGEHVRQAGSVVGADRLRFDFNHHKALTPEQIRQIEDLVNGKIRANDPVETSEISYEEAQKRKEIRQFFGEKYGSRVRVVGVGVSKELCGGVHTSYAGNIGYFRIAKEGSIAAGVRRIEAVTGEEAENFARQAEDALLSHAEKLKTDPGKLSDRIDKLLEESQQLQQELKQHQNKEQSGVVKELLEKREELGATPVVISKVEMGAKQLRSCAEQVMQKLGSGILILGNIDGDKCNLLVQVSDDHVAKGWKANELIQLISPLIEGGGGGKANAAQAGGKAPEKMGEALDKAREEITKRG